MGGMDECSGLTGREGDEDEEVGYLQGERKHFTIYSFVTKSM